MCVCVCVCYVPFPECAKLCRVRAVSKTSQPSCVVVLRRVKCGLLTAARARDGWRGRGRAHRGRDGENDGRNVSRDLHLCPLRSLKDWNVRVGVTRPGASVGTVTWESDRTGRALVRSLTQGARRMWPVGARDGAMPIASRRPRPPKGSSQGRFVRDPRSRGGAHKPLARTRRKQRERWKRGHLYSGVDNWDLRDP